MANEQLHITTYNCKHFYYSGDKFDFINKSMCDSEFLFLHEICLYETVLNKLLKLGHNRVCGLLYGENDSLTMLLNVYMPCDKNTYDHVFMNVLNTISLLLYKHNPCYIIIGGNINVDISRSSPNTRVLSDFITDFNVYTCIDLPNTNAPYTFINYNNSTSRIDHFLV